MTLSNIWVLAETTPTGEVAPITLEILAKARELADDVTVVFGGDGDDIAETVGNHGAETVLATGDLEGKLPGVHLAAAIAAAIEDGDAPDAFFAGATYTGRDVISRLSVKLDRPVLTNNSGVELDGDDLVVETQIFGGTQIVRTKFTTDGPALALFQPKAFVAEETGDGEADVEDLDLVDVGAAGEARIIGRHVEETTGPQLDEADVVIAGGRGLGEPDKFEMIEQLAKLTKGAPGATRAIVDAGWVPYSYQIGQTGKIVKPTAYIAAGISGATQHMVGMKGSQNIIAINKDPEAPIFGVADLGIVGDVHKVLPKVIEALEAR